MGFEITYSFHERLEAGGYNKDETKQMKRKVGDAYDDVPLEKVATAIMQQLARRDVWVVGVEIAECIKKKITFRETDGGIVIKNRKFLLDNTGIGGIVSQEIPEPSSAAQPIVYPHQAIRPQRQSAQPQRPRVKKKMAFMPSRMDLARTAMLKVGARLTVEKEYDIVAEVPVKNGVGMTLAIVDDVGREVEISDEFFVPTQVNLLADQELGFSKSTRQSDGGTLNWHGAYNETVPDIRSR